MTVWAKNPIWLTANGFVSAEEALLPGDFSDPIGQTTLIKQQLLAPKVRQFLQDKLGVTRQTIEEYVRVVVPRFVGDSGPSDLNAYKTLLETLANHLGLLDDDELRGMLAALPIIPTRDGEWTRPDQTYFRTDELASVLGESEHRWVHITRVGKSHSVRTFLEALGVRRSPSATHLADRMVEIAENDVPTEGIRRSSEKTFYALCDLYKARPEGKDVQDAISTLTDAYCFPADGNDEEWFSPAYLHAPVRVQAFESQADILGFKNFNRLSFELLGELGVALEPETELVVNHLLHCVAEGAPAHTLVYQILNERAAKEDPDISPLLGQPCIYLGAHEGYVRPNQLYRVPQQLGKYTYSIPAGMDQYKDLFRSLGVKETPEASDYVDVLLDLVEENYAPQRALSPVDQRIHETCLAGISVAWHDGELSEADFDRLCDAPSVPNLSGRLRHPDELLLRDSEWHRGFFGSELDDMLCQRFDPALTPLLEQLGIQRLSEVATVKLDFVDGPENVEDWVTECLIERSEIFARMLHDQPRTVRDSLQFDIQRLTARSHDIVRIKATIALDEEAPISAEPSEVKAYYDSENQVLVLMRPVESRSWVQLFSAFLHQLMPEEPASHISHLSLALQPLMGMSLTEAEEWLADAHVPFLEVESDDKIDLTSRQLEGLGAESGSDDEAAGQPWGEEEESTDEEAGYDEDAVGDESDEEDETSTESENVEDAEDEEPDVKAPTALVESDTRRVDTTGAPGPGSGGTGGPPDHESPVRDSRNRTKRGRSKSKSLWDRELISYARQKRAESDQGPEDGGDEPQDKLAIEAAARAAVCRYERERGRNPEEMPQTHPGYDIVSRNAETDRAERYIEVKGTSGEWNIRGVGLSRLQFTTAQEQGERFWLYVVECALDEDAARVHAIQNPAQKVDHFMFDGGWRDVAIDERPDPMVPFVPGARIDCGARGEGVISEVQKRGALSIVIVEFNGGRKIGLPLDLKTMRVVSSPVEETTR